MGLENLSRDSAVVNMKKAWIKWDFLMDHDQSYGILDIRKYLKKKKI